jgi:type II secretory pathway pseudopilin PulG
MIRWTPIRALALPRSAPPALSTATAGRARHTLPDSGYALLAVVFLAALMLLAAAVAAPVLVTQGRREKEEELIWRGQQHVRAIKLYYRKTGHFPKDLSDLAEPKNGIHFLRKAYKDPMNRENGAWRLIYVGPGGQLIGSVTRTSISGFPQAPQAGLTSKTAGAAPVPQPVRRLETNPTGDQNPVPPDEGGTGTGTEANPAAPLAPPKTGLAGAGATGEGQVFGGSLIGVASKVDRSSIKFYNGYGKYKEWEFIWDPQAEAAAAAGLTITPGGVQAPQPDLFPGPPQPPPTNPPQ